MTGKHRRGNAAPRIERLESRTLLSIDGWQGYARDPQHTALSPVASASLAGILWQAPVDLAPQYSGNDLLIHYGSPLVTASNTVIVPVKTGASGGFEIQARSGASGALRWTLTTDYALMPSSGIDGYSWTPSYSPTLTPANRLYFPGLGGTVYYTDSPDAAGPSPPATGRLAFFGLSNYTANPSAYNSTVFINTPITSDASGDIFFGFLVTGSNPLGLTSGVARIDANGTGSYAAVVSSARQVATNSAPALSNDGSTLYVLENLENFGSGKLVALNSQTLALKAQVSLIDPYLLGPATISNDATASPMVGPDGDVYIGVLEYSFASNHDRGWLLHFSGDLSTTKTPGAFGWDDTPSVVPASMVPSYKGTSTYLLMTKYNDYAGEGGTGINKIAVLDPNATEIDPVTGKTVMNEVLTIAGPTPDPQYDGTHPGAVREWCINTAAVDPATDSILANSEDGKLYRWSLATNTFTQQVTLTQGVGEAYTPTLIGVDGTVYAINNATLFAVGVNKPPTLDPIANQTIAAGGSVTIALGGHDPDGDTLTYSATAETQPYWLKQTYGIYEDSGGYYTSARGQQEKYLRGKVSANGYNNGGGDFWYYILPNGDFYEFTPPYSGNPNLTGALVAHLGTSVYNDPSLLWNAANSPVPVTLTVSGNQLTIMPGSGYTGTFVVIASVNDGAGNVASQAFKVTVPSSNTPPTLDPIADQTIAAGGSRTITLGGHDPDGDPLTYSASAETQPYWLKQTYGIYEDSGGYYTSARGQQEKYYRGTVSANGYGNGGGDFWYYILPNGDFYEFTPPYSGNPNLTGALVAHLGTSVYNDPSLLWNAANSPVPVTLTVSGNQLTIMPGSGYTGTFVVIASVNDGAGNAASQPFKVTVTSGNNTPPTLDPIADQTIAAGGSRTITLGGHDPDGDPLTYSASAETQPYWLKQSYGIYEDSGGYYTSARGQQEKYLRGKVSANGYNNGGGDFWYYILPNGDFYEFTPPYSGNPNLTGALVAHLGTSVYNDPSLLWNAANSPVPVTLTVSGNQLTIMPGSGYTGTFVVIASVNDGAGNAASQAFKVTVPPSNTPPTLDPIANQTIAAGGSRTITLGGHDPDGDPLTYSATAETQPYWLKQTYGIYEDSGGYHTSAHGQQEKYLRGTISANGYGNGGGDFWYYILPNGDFYEFTPPYGNPNLTGALVAHLGTSVYNDPSLLWNAANSPVPVTLTVSGNQLTITPGSGYTGTFVVIASVNDGSGNTASQAFNVTVS